MIGALEAAADDVDRPVAGMRTDHREGEVGARVHARDGDRHAGVPVDAGDAAVGGERREANKGDDESRHSAAGRWRRGPARSASPARSAGPRHAADVPVATGGEERADRNEQRMRDEGATRRIGRAGRSRAGRSRADRGSTAKGALPWASRHGHSFRKTPSMETYPTIATPTEVSATVRCRSRSSEDVSARSARIPVAANPASAESIIRA